MTDEELDGFLGGAEEAGAKHGISDEEFDSFLGGAEAQQAEGPRDRTDGSRNSETRSGGDETTSVQQQGRAATSVQQQASWLDGDGGERTVGEGQTNQWGGNLRNEGRRVLLRRDKAGKVNGYSTTSSMIYGDENGKWNVIPTVVDGNELTKEQAVEHYKATGEKWGTADDVDAAKKMAWEVHCTHASKNQKAWNDYLLDNWDEVSDEIKSDRGMQKAYDARRPVKKVLSNLSTLFAGSLDKRVVGHDEITPESQAVRGALDMVNSIKQLPFKVLGVYPEELVGYLAKSVGMDSVGNWLTNDAAAGRENLERWFPTNNKTYYNGDGTPVDDWGVNAANTAIGMTSGIMEAIPAAATGNAPAAAQAAYPILLTMSHTAERFNELYNMAIENGATPEDALGAAEAGASSSAVLESIMWTHGAGKTVRDVGNEAGRKGVVVNAGGRATYADIEREAARQMNKQGRKFFNTQLAKTMLIVAGQKAANEEANQIARGEFENMGPVAIANDNAEVGKAALEGAVEGAAIHGVMTVAQHAVEDGWRGEGPAFNREGTPDGVPPRSEYSDVIAADQYRFMQSKEGRNSLAQINPEATADLIEQYQKTGKLPTPEEFAKAGISPHIRGELFVGADGKPMTGSEGDVVAAQAYARLIEGWIADGITPEGLRGTTKTVEGTASASPLATQIEHDGVDRAKIGQSFKDLRESIRASGETPKGFDIPLQIDPNTGRPVGAKQVVSVDRTDGTQTQAWKIGESNGVQLFEHQDGTYLVRDKRGNEVTLRDPSTALAYANLYALQNQRADLDNEIKMQFIGNPQDHGFQGTVPSMLSAINQLRHEAPDVLAAWAERGIDMTAPVVEFPDGSKILVLDNIRDKDHLDQIILKGEVDATPPELDETIVGKEKSIMDRLNQIWKNGEPQRGDKDFNEYVVLLQQLNAVKEAKKRIAAREAEKKVGEVEADATMNGGDQDADVVGGQSEPEVPVVDEKQIVANADKDVGEQDATTPTTSSPLGDSGTTRSGETRDGETTSVRQQEGVGVKTAVKEKPSETAVDEKPVGSPKVEQPNVDKTSPYRHLPEKYVAKAKEKDAHGGGKIGDSIGVGDDMYITKTNGVWHLADENGIYHDDNEDGLDEITDDDRAKYSYLPDEYIPWTKKIEGGELNEVRDESGNYYPVEGKKYGIVSDKDGELHLVDKDTGEQHDEVKTRIKELAHRGSYVKQSAEKDHYTIPFTKTSVPFENLTLDQIKSQRKRFAHKSDDWRLQRFDDDAFVYNDKWRRLKSAEATDELNKAKSEKTLASAIERAGHYVEIAGDSVPETLVGALSDAKRRLVEIKTSAGGKSASEINEQFGIDKWADSQSDPVASSILAKGHLFKNEFMTDFDAKHQLSASDRKFVMGGVNDDGSMDELLRDLSIDPEVEIDGRGNNTTAVIEMIVNRALKARGEYQQWRDNQIARYKERKRGDAEHEVEVLSRGRKYDIIANGEGYRLEELEARKDADDAYVNAKAFVENEADENDYAIMTPAHLVDAAAHPEKPTVIRLDHEKQTFSILTYDDKNGILTVFDPEDTSKPNRLFRVTADDIKEITHDTRTEENAAGNVPADAQEQGEGKGGVQAAGGEGRGVVGGRRSAGMDRGAKAKVYRLFDPGDQAFDEKDALGAVEALGRGEVASVIDEDAAEISDKEISDWEKGCRGVILKTRDDAAHLLERLSNPDREIAKVFYVAKDGRIIEAKVVDIGLVGTATMPIDKILAGIPEGTYGIITSHNHPDGSVKPSRPDVRSCLARAEEIAKKGVKFLEDFITDSDRYVSLGIENPWWQAVPEIVGDASGFWKDDGTTVEQPESRFNVIPYDERVNLISDDGSAYPKIASLSDRIAKIDHNGTYILGVADNGDVTSTVKVRGHNDFGKAIGRCSRFIVLSGNETVDRQWISDTLDGVAKKNGNVGDDFGIIAVVPLYEKGMSVYNGSLRCNDGYLNLDDMDMVLADIARRKGAAEDEIEEIVKLGKEKLKERSREDNGTTLTGGGEDIEAENEKDNKRTTARKTTGKEDSESSTASGEDNKRTTTRKKKVTGRLTGGAEKKAAGVLDAMRKFKGTLKAPVEKLQAVLKDDHEIKSLLKEFGETKDIAHALLVTPSGKMVSDANAFIGHDTFGEVTVKAIESRLDKWANEHGGDDAELPSDPYFREFLKKSRSVLASAGARIIYDENHLFGDGTMTIDRAIAEYHAHEATGGIYSLLKKGVIRVASNNGGLEIGAAPTENQIGFIYDYADWHSQNDGRGFSVDFVGENGARDSVYYDKHVSPSKIIDDARAYFTTGKIEKSESSIRDFLYAPVEKLEGGVKGVYTGSRIDYDTVNGLFGIGANGVKPTFGWGLYGSKRRETAVNYAGGKNKGIITEQTWFGGREVAQLLKWSSPVSAEDKKRIRDNWKREFGNELPKSVQLTSGATAYRTIEKALGSNIKASEFLSRSGIDGMNSGDLYVAFSPESVRVDAKEKEGVRAPVEQLGSGLTKEQRRELRNMTEDLVEALQEAGMGDFESVVRYISENDQDTYEKLRPYLRAAYIGATDEDLTSEDANRIYGIIDEEIKNGTDDDTEAEGRGDAEQEGESQPVGGEGTRAGGRSGVRGGRGRAGDRESDERPDVTEGSGGFLGRGDDGRKSVQQHGNVGGGDGGSLRESGEERGGSGVQSGDGRRDAADAVPADHGESVGAGELRDVQPSGSVEGEVTPGFMRYKPPEDLPVKSPSSDSLIVETSALASTTAPKIEKKPNIPDEIPESGTLQAHQYHSVCQAVNAHEKFLPDGRRYGYFCADGTGCGKTRIIAGIMLDAIRNMHGNGRCLIVSQKENLFDDAVKDFTPFGIGEKLFKLDSGKVGTKSPLAVRGQGIAFTMYNRLAKDYNGTGADGKVNFSNGKSACQFNDILKWLGGTKPEDYDGVIAFDEVHTASKDSAVEDRAQTTYAQAVIDLQRLLPKARIVYLTATAAYDPDNLRFLERMGLWGKGTGFKSRNDFVAAFGRNSENVSLMEVMTQGLKSRGLYCARSISFKGVKCKRFVQKLTPEQRETHNEIRKMMFAIHNAIPAACDATGYPTLVPMKQFFGSGLRIFGSMMTAFKVEKAVELGKTALAEGKCPIFQIIETGAAAKNDKAKKAGKAHMDTLFGSEDAHEEDGTISLRDKLIKFLNTDACFPTHEPIYAKINGRMVRTGWGDEVPEAAEMRDRLIAMAKRLPAVGNPIDLIEAAFKEDGVSRVTGEVPAAKRGEIIDAFNNGNNRVLIFSAAGGTGASYHASPKFKNQRQRVQIPVEFGWKPEDFIQALGRSHRNNQVIAPEFWLLTTDMPGEMRFMSTIASRIASMGAIVGGDRNSSGQVVGSGDSIDNRYGKDAIKDFADKVAAGNGYAGVPSTTITSEMMIGGDKIRGIDTEKFLGRLQLLSFDSQKAIYDKVAENMQTRIDEAKEAGEYDDGIKKIDARRVVVKDRKGVEGADVGIVTTGEWHKSQRLSNEDFERKANGEKSRIVYARNKRSGNLFGFINSASGKIYQYSPSRGYVGIVEPMDYRANFDSVPSGAAKDEWDEKYGATPAEIESEASYVTGDLFPVWNKIGVDYPSVLRGIPENSKPFIGVKLVDAQLANALYGFGKKDEARKLFSEKGFEWLKRGTRYGIGEGGEQPILRTGSIGGQRVMMVRNLEANGAVADYLAADPHWESGWYKDPNVVSDRGDDVMYMPLGKEGTEDAYEYLVGKFGVFQRKDGNLRFASKEPTGTVENYERPMNRPDRETPRETRSGTTRSGGNGKFGINIDIHQEGDSIVFRPMDRAAWKGLDAVKKALGGVEAVSHRGERYVKSNIINKKYYRADRKLYKVPMSEIPQQYHAELLDNGTTLKAEVEPIRQLMRDPKALSNAVVYDILRAEVMPLDAGVYSNKTEDELVKIALADPDAVGAIGELYQRAHKKLPGMIRVCCGAYSPKPEEVYDIESDVWTAETEHGGLLQEFRNKNTELFKDGFENVLWSKARRFSKDFLRKGAKEAERTVHTDAKGARMSESGTANLIEKDIDNAGFVDQVTDTILSAINAKSYDNARKRLAEIFTQLDDYGMPEKYMGWLRKYLEEVGNLGVEFDVDNIGLFNDYEHRFVYERGHKVDKFLINRRKFIENNILKRLGQLGRNPQKLFEHEFGQMLKAIRLWQNENDSRFLPGEAEANASYSNAELIDIMEANGDDDWADVCRERENGLTGEEIAKKLGMTHANIRQILHRASVEYGYHYDGPNVNRPIQTNWFDLLGVPGEITKTPKVEKKVKAKSNVVQDDLFGGLLKAPVEPLDSAEWLPPQEMGSIADDFDIARHARGVHEYNLAKLKKSFATEMEKRKAVEGLRNIPLSSFYKGVSGVTPVAVEYGRGSSEANLQSDFTRNLNKFLGDYRESAALGSILVRDNELGGGLLAEDIALKDGKLSLDMGSGLAMDAIRTVARYYWPAATVREMRNMDGFDAMVNLVGRIPRNILKQIKSKSRNGRKVYINPECVVETRAFVETLRGMAKRDSDRSKMPGFARKHPVWKFLPDRAVSCGDYRALRHYNDAYFKHLIDDINKRGDAAIEDLVRSTKEDSLFSNKDMRDIRDYALAKCGWYGRFAGDAEDAAKRFVKNHINIDAVSDLVNKIYEYGDVAIFYPEHKNGKNAIPSALARELRLRLTNRMAFVGKIVVTSDRRYTSDSRINRVVEVEPIKRTPDLFGRFVPIVVDDVMTVGGTIASCANEIVRSGLCLNGVVPQVFVLGHSNRFGTELASPTPLTHVKGFDNISKEQFKDEYGFYPDHLTIQELRATALSGNLSSRREEGSPVVESGGSGSAVGRRGEGLSVGNDRVQHGVRSRLDGAGSGFDTGSERLSDVSSDEGRIGAQGSSSGGVGVQRATMSPTMGVGDATLHAPIEPLDTADNRGFYNEEVDRFRRDMGLSPLKKDATVSLESIEKRGRAMANNELELLKKINVWATTNYPINAVEQAALDYYGVKLSQEAANLHARMKQAEANGDKVIAEQLHDQIFNDILPRLENIQKVQRRVGREWGLAGRIRQLMYGPDMSIATFMVACRKAAGGKLPDNVAELAGVIWDKLHDANIAVKDNQDKVAIADQVVRAMKVVKKVDDEAKAKRRGAPGEAKIIENYANALLQIEHWGKVKGGVLAAIPNIHKLMTDMMGYYYLTGEGYGDDGKPSMDKVVALAQRDLHNCGVDTDAYDIRQAICEMGKLSQPSKNEIEKAKRETRKQMLLAQQMAYFMEHGELPPKTGWEDIEDSDVIREMRRMRDRMFKDAKDRAGSDTRLASALKRMKTVYRNKIEDLNKKIEVLKNGGTLPEEAKKRGVMPDEELQRLIDEKKAREDELNALNDPDGLKELEKQTVRLIDRLTKHAKKLQDELDLAKRLGTGYEWDKDTTKPWDDDPRVKAIRERIAEINNEKKELHDELFPEGTSKEQTKYFERREAALQKQLGVWESALKNIEGASTLEEKLKAAKPYGTRAATKENLRTLELKKNRDAAHKKCLDLLKQIERDNTRGGNLFAWAHFVSSAPVLLYTMLDLSVAGIQGGKQMLMHPKLWAKATVDGMKSMFSQKETDKIVLDLNSNPYTDEFVKHGGHLYAMDGLGDDKDVPEDFRALMSGPKWFGGKTVDIGKIPGVKRSARAFSAFLNRLNVEAFRRIVEGASVDGPLTDYQKFCIARFINNASGYGFSSTARNAKNQEMLSNMSKLFECFAWAPRKVMGEIKFVTGVDLLEPLVGTKRVGQDKVTMNDILRAEKIIGKEKARFVAGLIAFAVMSILASILLGNEFDIDDFFNPESSDFMMVRSGNTKIDVTRGLAKYIRTATRIITGKKNVNGVRVDTNRAVEAYRFFAGKATPWISKLTEFISGENIFGKKIGEAKADAVKNYLMPITHSGLWDNFVANDPLTAIFNAFLVFTGNTQYTETDHDDLKRPADQYRHMNSKIENQASLHDDEGAKKTEEWLTEKSSDVMRAEAGAEAANVLSLESKVKENEKKIAALKTELKSAWQRTRHDQIQGDISALEAANTELNNAISGLRKEAQKKVDKFKWSSSSMK